MYPARVISDTYLNWGRLLEDEIGMEMHYALAIDKISFLKNEVKFQLNLI